jgi:pyridoxal 5'-phosphate synthase pdxT subunit
MSLQWDPLVAWVTAGKPTWGTCAGLILLADCIIGGKEGQRTLGGMDVTVQRNYFGSQVASTTAVLDVEPGFRSELLKGATFEEGEPSGVFIRAPAITATGPAARAVAWVMLPSASELTPSRVSVAATQGRLLGTAFHPELTPQRCWHRYFARMVSAVYDEHAHCPLSDTAAVSHESTTSHGQ